MTRLPIIVAAAAFFFACFTLRAQQDTNSTIEIRSLQTGQANAVYDLRHHTAAGTNGIFIDYKGTILTADSVFLDKNTGEAIASGNVRIQQGDELYAGDHMRYNFHTHQMISDEFRSGKPPVFMEGRGLHGNVVSNRLEKGTYTATNGILTTDDVSKPFFKIRANRIRITPNDKVQAWDAMLYIGDVPVFYFPYYSRNLGPHANNFDFVPGYRSSFGLFILGEYTWWMNDELNGKFHLDYRERRGVG